MKNLPDRVLSHPGSEVPSRVEASSQGREIRLHEPRFLEAATERADSTVKPLRVALADGETDPAALAALADRRLRATPEQLHDALGACQDLHPLYRRLVKAALE